MKFIAEKDARELNAQIDTVNAEIERLSGDVEDAQRSVAIDGAVDAEIADLQRKRAEILGAAFIAKQNADTREVDSALAAAEQRRLDDKRRSEGATAAVTIINGQIEELGQKAAKLVLQRDRLLLSELTKAEAACIESYVKQVNRIGNVLRELRAIEVAIRRVRGPHVDNSMHFLADRLVSSLIYRGLHVPDGHAQPAHPGLHQKGNTVPADWLLEIGNSPERFAAEETAELDALLNELM